MSIDMNCCIPQYSTSAFLEKMLGIHLTLQNMSAGKKADLLLLKDNM